MTEEYEEVSKDFKVRIIEEKEEVVTFSELLGRKPFEWKQPCIYILARFFIPQAVPEVLVELTGGGALGHVAGVERYIVRWIQVGQAQMNIVDNVALVWECIIYPDATVDWEKILEKALDWLEAFLKAKGVKVVFINPYEPMYEGYTEDGKLLAGEKAPKEWGWWSKYLKSRGYTESSYELFNRKVLKKKVMA